MSERSPRKSGLSPSPLALALAIVLATITTLGAVYFFTIGLTAPSPAQTGAFAKSNELPTKVAKQEALAKATATEPPATEEPTELATSTLTIPEEQPQSTPYIPGPTAQFSKWIPVEEWLTYTDEQARFSVKYPPDWYLVTVPKEYRVFGSTTSLYSYDINNPALAIEGKSGIEHPNYTKIEIGVAWNLEAIGSSFVPGESIFDWAQRNLDYSTIAANETESTNAIFVREERHVEVGGKPAYMHVVSSSKVQTPSKRNSSVGIYVKNGELLTIIHYPLEPEDSFNARVLQAILDSIVFSE